jgi:hypothetical protein
MNIMTSFQVFGRNVPDQCSDDSTSSFFHAGRISSSDTGKQQTGKKHECGENDIPCFSDCGD